MQTTRRTIVTAAASFAVVLGVGSVAAAMSGHSEHAGPTTGISLPGAHHKPTKASVRTDVQEATSTTETEGDTSSKVEPSTTTTLEQKTSTAVRVQTPDAVESNLGNDDADDQGEATDEANENENAELDEHDETPSTPVAETPPAPEVDDHHTDAGQPEGDRSGSSSETGETSHGGDD
jgi:hypothetical protein